MDLKGVGLYTGLSTGDADLFLTCHIGCTMSGSSSDAGIGAQGVRFREVRGC